MKTAFVDTNVAVYLHDIDEPAKQALALAVFESDEFGLVVSTQVLLEFYVTVRRKLAATMSADDVDLAMAALLDLPVVGADADFVVGAIDLAARHQLSPWDGMIVQAAIVGGCDTLLTEDLADGAVYDGVRVVNPFAEAA